MTPRSPNLRSDTHRLHLRSNFDFVSARRYLQITQSTFSQALTRFRHSYNQEAADLPHAVDSIFKIRRRCDGICYRHQRHRDVSFSRTERSVSLLDRAYVFGNSVVSHIEAGEQFARNVGAEAGDGI